MEQCRFVMPLRCFAAAFLTDAGGGGDDEGRQRDRGAKGVCCAAKGAWWLARWRM